MGGKRGASHFLLLRPHPLYLPPNQCKVASDAPATSVACSDSSQATGVLPTSKPLLPFKTPKSPEDWAEVDVYLARYVVPAVITAKSLEEKNSILCQGIYNHMTSRFRVRKAGNQTSRKRQHERGLKRITKEKNAARKELRRARRCTTDEDVIRDLSITFHKLL